VNKLSLLQVQEMQSLVAKLMDEEKDILYGGLISFNEAKDIATKYVSTYNPSDNIRRYHNVMLQRSKAGDKRAKNYVKFLLYKSLNGQNIGGYSKGSVVNVLLDTMFGLDILAPLWARPEVEEIRVNRWDDVRVSIGGISHATDITFRNTGEVFNMIKRLTVHAGTDINYSSPHIRCKLYDGSRLTASIEPETDNGFVLRKHNVIPPTTEAMLAQGTVTEELTEFLRFVLDVDWTVIIGGKTNSGKTHTLRWMLSQLLQPDVRIATAERVKELHLRDYFDSIGKKMDIVEFEEVEQIGRTLQKIIETLMRYSPDKIIVGEALGKEVKQMLDANRRGHPGGISTMHSYDLWSMIASAISMYSEDESVKREQKMMEREIAETIDVYMQQGIFIDKNGKKIRKVTGIDLLAYDREKDQPITISVAKIDNDGIIRFNPSSKIDHPAFNGLIERVRNKGYGDSDLKAYGLL
jgi:pilus assembly protein CpaF